ncbi:acetyl-CoA carboxylase biotin carboxylase subunit family protein [Chryseobacterium indologenes]|uniref:ATP-grasp domain-containing protein n=1 Tax=Chryseobacterium indologenes TaxID=253 RepID=A0A0N1KTB0_CHRID|nr:ATP-grasp domain-containing protein [Chryseobacterium indologenes]KPE51545.1 hypothetical protein AOB46_07690 [Chryseobacterium indologenes]
MRKIAILGASYLQLPLVQKAKKNGLEVHCFAWDDGKAVCKDVSDFFYDISVLDKEKILETCEKVNINGIITIATDICIPTISYVASHLNLISNTEECALLTTNKSAMRKCFYENSIPSPRFTTLRSYMEDSIQHLNYPLVVKPSDRSGSLGVVKVFNESECQEAIEKAIEVSFSKTCVVEEFIEGSEVSVETVSWQGCHHIITITDKIITEEPYFVELAHHQPSNLPQSIQNQIKKITLEVLKVTEVEYGASHIEFKITAEGKVYVVEIGSRMGGDFIGSDLVELSTGFDYVQSVIDIAMNEYQEKNMTFSGQHYSGVYFLSKNTEIILNYFKNDPINDDFSVIKKEIQNDELKDVKSSNDRSGYLIYQADKRIDLL